MTAGPKGTTAQDRRFSGYWFGRASAGFLLGFALALALVGLFFYLAPSSWPPSGGRYMLLRWLIPPLWLAVLSTCFLFRSGTAAWAWLGGATTVAFIAMACARLAALPG